jgi:uncharacterized protein
MIILLVVFFAVFTQAVSGFGLALVSMPLLVGVIGVKTATPLVALVAIVAEIILLLHYRHAIDFHAVMKMSLAALVGIPVGIWLLDAVAASIITKALGLIVTLYALYALFRFRLPSLVHQVWAYGFGFVGGVLGSAFNTSGPPVIIYGTCRHWSPDQFKSNLQGYFVPLSAGTIIAHFANGNVTQLVWHHFWWAMPGVVLGTVVGFALNGRIDPIRFRQIVLLLLIIIGVRLLF